MFPAPVSEQGLEDIMLNIKKRFANKPKVAIAGFGKAGKSSLFNAIYGENVVKVSMRTDETAEAQTRERFGIDFTDTPGIGTGKFSFEKVQQMGVFDRQHVVIHVLNGASAISAEDEQLHELIEQSEAKRITVVNKVDILDEQEQADYAQSIMERLGLFPRDFFFVSAKKGIRIADLIQRIVEILPEAMRDAFIAEQNADLALKEKRIRNVVYSKAVICAATAAIPVPISDIFILTPIQIAMIVTIGCFHGVEVTKERALELMATLGTGVGLREVARQLIKLVPGYGQVVSASIAFAGTVALGETANAWFKKKMKIEAEELLQIFTKTAEQAKQDYQGYSQRQVQLKQQLGELRKQLDSGTISQDDFENKLLELNNSQETKKSDSADV